MINGWMQGWRKRKGSAMVPLFASYIVILLLAIVIGSMLYWKATTIVQHTVENSNAAMLQQLREVVDGRLREIEQLEQQIAFHPKLGKLLNSDRVLAEQEAYAVVEFASELRRFKTLANLLIYDFYIYADASQTLVGPGVKSTPQVLFDGVYRFPGKSSKDWTEEFQRLAMRKYDPSVSVQSSDGAPLSMITYRQSLPYGNPGDVRGSLIVLIDESQLRALFDKLAAVNQGEIYIVDSENRIVSSTATNGSASSAGLFSYGGLYGETGKQELVSGGEATIASYTTSGVNGWKYVYVVPSDVFLDQVYAVKKWALILLTLCVVGGVAASLYLAYRNYRPVRDVVRAIRTWRASDTVQEQAGGEYDLIRSTIESARLTESRLRERLEQQSPIIRVNFLRRLIRGYADPAELKPEALAFAGFSFQWQSFAVLLIEVDDISGFAQAGEREWPFVSFIIANIAGELANERHQGYPVELDRGRVAMLVNVRQEREAEAAADLKAVAGGLSTLLADRFRLQATVAVGGPVSGASRIGEAFLAALAALEEELSLGREHPAAGPIGGAGDLVSMSAEPDETGYYYPLEAEQQLLNVVKSGDSERAIKLLDAICADNFDKRGISAVSGRYLLVHLTGTMYRLLQSHPGLKQLVTEQLVSLDNKGGDLDEAFGELKRVYVALCGLLRERRGDAGERLLSGVREHIERHYGDNMLSVNSIADAFELTPQYLSTVFKKAGGQNLADYIAEVRLREAKRLLADTSETLAAIALRVGYANDIGFIRFFKKYEGVTPGAYRTSLDTDR
jgi:two-component system response regulator YesN